MRLTQDDDMIQTHLVSIGAERSQDGQRNVEFVHDSRGLISQSNITMKLIGLSLIHI